MMDSSIWAEAYLSGFSDGYHKLSEENYIFSQHSDYYTDFGFRMKYRDGYAAGKDKRNAEKAIEESKKRLDIHRICLVCKREIKQGDYVLTSGPAKFSDKNAMEYAPVNTYRYQHANCYEADGPRYGNDGLPEPDTTKNKGYVKGSS